MCRSVGVITIVLIAASAQAQTITQHDDDTLTVRAESVALAAILTELARLYPLERLTIERDVQQHPVSVTLDRVPRETALVAILRASGLDFAIAGRRVVVGKWTTTSRAATDATSSGASSDATAATSTGQAARPDADERDAEQRHAERAAVEADAQHALWAAWGDETTIFPMPPVAFIANGENITYLEPNFVPYKMRPEVRARRMAIDVSKIP